MGRAAYGTANYSNKQLKAKGLQKLKFYCQACKKQCRDDNGFKSHIKSPSHVRKISQISQKDIDEYTRRFEVDFLRLLRLTHGEKKIEVNKFYNKYIQDRDHIHMNATRFTSLTNFVKYLGQSGKIRVHSVGLSQTDNKDEIDTSRLLISYIDNSQDNLLRKEQLQEISKNERSDQEIKMMLLHRQMESAVSNEKEEEERQEEMPRLVDKFSLNLRESSNQRPKRRRNINKNVFENIT